MAGEYKDKKASLIVFGIIEILGGLLCALLAAIIIISVAISPNEMSVLQIWMGMSVYVFLAVWLIWVAIGTIRARRWTRVLMLAASWLMLAVGILAMGMMVFILSKSYASLGLPNEIAKGILIGTYITLAVIYLLVPAVGILFYGNRNVRATVEHHDPGPSWTEHCPLPVLILVVILAMVFASSMMMAFMNFAIPVFGTILTGWKGAVVLLGVLGSCIALAVGVYRQRSAAWWGVLAGLFLSTASQLVTFSRVDLMEFYEAMGYSDQMLQQMQSMNWMDSSMFGVIAAVYAVPGFIYLLLIKRYFKKSTWDEDDG